MGRLRHREVTIPSKMKNWNLSLRVLTPQPTHLAVITSLGLGFTVFKMDLMRVGFGN